MTTMKPVALPAWPTLRPRALLLAMMLACGLTAGTGSGVSRGDDAVVLADGDRIRGSIVSTSPEAIELELADGKIEKFLICDIREVSFDGEPQSLAAARGLLIRKDGPGALTELDKVDKAELESADPPVREEHDYLRVAAAARAATAADGQRAAQALQAFLAEKPRSHHRYDAHEILGDLLARLGAFDAAVAAYGELDRGPPALRVRSAAVKAQLLLQQGKPTEALKEFQAASTIDTDPSDDASREQKAEAALGMARCLASIGKAADGITAARATIQGADPADRALLAKAFAALGTCQRAAGGEEQAALISYLTVDLVYNSVPDAHAEALYNLVELWEATKQPERSRAARQALLQSYPQSSWAKKLGDAAAS
jgi:tetratricopeptide (TPR) repeat protein